ncbi:DNA-directed RNA polymerase subunit alpha [Endomicrobium proavitum]|uniref:DNA-directed RNA polymerase subunit alpha n=1 Tax=Endomicrobium proavitum TaxID=1408281 RepID=A0A0G3WLF4_9BACT|nr:DNA-directed RNA polymerase subunit alpha [Endomicrobium proavitum]AKL98697.1 DNA-directed RNA polymerase subunit alpha [Endomicrobium proavitum]
MKTPDLEKLRKLTLEEKTATQFYGRFTAEPFERGYGHTIGNSLRRILLSSLEGAAVTSVKITGALHEFAVLKGVKEDVAQIVLNLKKIRVNLRSEGAEKLYLKVKKAGKVTAKDIEANANVEILNPEQEIANIDNGTVLEMELEVSSGKGYVVAEDIKNNKHSVGTIVLDSLFSPITKVNYEVENTRVEQILNYDRLVLEIWTDGSIAPKDALVQAAKILRNSLNIFTGNVSEESEVEEAASNTEEEKGAELLDQPLSIIDLSTRSSNSLKNAGLETIGDLVKITEEDLMNFENFGKRSLEEIKEKLAEIGLSFGMDIKKGAKK